MKLKFLVFVLLVSICSIAAADQSYTPAGAEPDALYAKLAGNQALSLRRFYADGVRGNFVFSEGAVFTELSDGNATLAGCLYY